MRNVIVVGGGTAGLISALTLMRVCEDVNVTIVRSSEIGHVMVGEGTVGSTPYFFHNVLGISRKDFFQQVRPTWKLGVRFLWGQRPYFDYTFTSQLDKQVLPGSHTPLAYSLFNSDWQGVSKVSEHMSHNNLPCDVDILSENGLPKDAAYHFENHAFVEFLENHFVQLGGKLIDAKVISASQSKKGIESIQLDTEQTLSADLFFDASGFRGELIHRVLNEPYVSMRDSLFCDRAIVGGWDRRKDEPIKPYTTAETMDAGWCWQIEHEHIINRGYVHCSHFISEDEAIAEFKKKNPRITDVRVVPFETRRIRNAWVKNVIAIGNASGFVEPLEATNIQVICSQSKDIADALNVSFDNEAVIEAYNRATELGWRNIRDFLALHYRFNDRLSTPFWDMVRSETSLGDLEAYVEYYQKTGPNELGLSMLPKVDFFSSEGYLVMLLGMKVPWHGLSNIDNLSEQESKLLTLFKRGNILSGSLGLNSEKLLSQVRSDSWEWN